MTVPTIDGNILATIISVIVGGGITYLFSRITKRSDARGQAEAALIGIGPQIITQQNERIKQQDTRMDILNQEIDKLWKRERECQDELNDAKERIETLEKRSLGISNEKPDPDATILIVDDTPEYSNMLSRQLATEGYKSFSVKTGEEALKWLRQHNFKLLILDVVLRGEIDGIQVALRARHEGFNMPIIAVTGYQNIIDEQTKNDIGFTAVLTKSQLRINQLIKTVKDSLGTGSQGTDDD